MKNQRSQLWLSSRLYSDDLTLCLIQRSPGLSLPTLIAAVLLCHDNADSVGDRCGNLLAIILACQLRDFFFVGEKSSFDQHRWRSHVGDHKKLFGFCPAINSPCPCDQRFLNKSGKILAFRIGRFGRPLPQKRQPRSQKRACSNLMGSIIGFHATRDRLVVLVEMNADKNAIAHPVGEGCTVSQRDIACLPMRVINVAIPSDSNNRSIRRATSRVRSFSSDSATHCPGVFSPMARIENNYCEWPGCRWRARRCRSLGGRRSRRQLHPDKGCDHQERRRAIASMFRVACFMGGLRENISLHILIVNQRA